MYADVDLWLSLLTGDGAADAALEEYGDDLQVAQVTFVQLFLLAEEYDLDRHGAITAILSLAEYDGDADELYRAATYHESGLDAFQAFQAAADGEQLVSGDPSYDDAAVERHWID